MSSVGADTTRVDPHYDGWERTQGYGAFEPHPSGAGIRQLDERSRGRGTYARYSVVLLEVSDYGKRIAQLVPGPLPSRPSL